MPDEMFIDSAGDGPNTDLSARSLPYAEDKAILKVARQIAAANDDDEQASHFFTQVIQSFALLDKIAPAFIELVDEYHIGENMQDTNCYLCHLREAAQEYLDKKQ
jgi:hypothetical protein